MSAVKTDNHSDTDSDEETGARTAAAAAMASGAYIIDTGASSSLTGESVAMLADSGAGLHACPPWHATHVPLQETKGSVTARGASGAAAGLPAGGGEGVVQEPRELDADRDDAGRRV